MKRSWKIRLAFFVLLSVLGGWFITAALIDDDPPVDLIEKYAEQDRRFVRNDLSAAMHGLHAPLGEDFYRYGQQLMINSAARRGDRLHLTDEVGIIDLDCITNYRRQVMAREACLDTDILTGYIAQNSVLLDRYMQILQISEDAGDEHDGLPLSGLIHLNKVALVKYALMAEQGEGEQALSLYNKNIAFVKNLMQRDTGFIGFAIAMNMHQDLVSFHPYFMNLIRKNAPENSPELEGLAFSWGQYKQISKRVMNAEIRRMFRHSLAASTGVDSDYHGWFGLRLADSTFDFHNVFLRRLDQINQDFVGAVDSAKTPQALISGVRQVIYDHYTSGMFAVRSMRELLNPTGHIKTNILVNEMLKGFGLFETFFYQNQLAEMADIFANPEFDYSRSYILAETDLPVLVGKNTLCVSNMDGVYEARKCLYTRH